MEIASAAGQADAGTRDRVARLLVERGPQTAAVLGERLGLTPAAVRRHLDTLAEQGAVVSRDQPAYGTRGRGRPAKVFVVTDAGRERFPHAYDDVAVSALRFLRETGGDEAVAAFARARVAGLEERLARALQGTPADERPAALAQALSDEGYPATARPGPHGAQVCQHHCPVAHVAAEVPELCEAETAAFGRLLGTHVQRLATIAHGDGVCTTHVPAPVPAVERTPTGRSSA